MLHRFILPAALALGLAAAPLALAQGISFNPAAAGASANTRGGCTLIGTTTNDGVGLEIHINLSSMGTTSKSVMRLATNSGCTTIIVPDIFFMPGNTAPVVIPVPLRTTAGTAIYAQAQSNNTSATFRVSIQIVKGASGLGYANCEAFAPFSSSVTRAGTIDLPIVLSGSTSFTQLVSSSAQAYGAFVFAGGENGTPASQRLQFRIATEPSGGGTASVFYTFGASPIGTAALLRAGPYLVRHTIAAGVPISVQVLGTTVGTDTFRINGIGCW